VCLLLGQLDEEPSLRLYRRGRLFARAVDLLDHDGGAAHRRERSGRTARRGELKSVVGRAGVGYALCRVAAPDLIPNLLAHARSAEHHDDVLCVDMRDDAVLVMRVRAGDVDSFSELFSRHAPVVRAAMRDTVSDREEQLDLVQEAFARALQRLASLKEPARFRAWLLQIARDAAIDNRRSAGRSVLVSIDEPDRPELPSG
jgi:hypothetical protein